MGRIWGVGYAMAIHTAEGVRVATDRMSNRRSIETLPLTLTLVQEELIEASREVAQLHEDLAKAEEHREAESEDAASAEGPSSSMDLFRASAVLLRGHLTEGLEAGSDAPDPLVPSSWAPGAAQGPEEWAPRVRDVQLLRASEWQWLNALGADTAPEPPRPSARPLSLGAATDLSKASWQLHQHAASLSKEDPAARETWEHRLQLARGGLQAGAAKAMRGAVGCTLLGELLWRYRLQAVSRAVGRWEQEALRGRVGQQPWGQGRPHGGVEGDDAERLREELRGCEWKLEEMANRAMHEGQMVGELEGKMKALDLRLRQAKAKSREWKLKAEEAEAQLEEAVGDGRRGEATGADGRMLELREKLIGAERRCREQSSLAEHAEELRKEAEGQIAPLEARILELQGRLGSGGLGAEDAAKRADAAVTNVEELEGRWRKAEAMARQSDGEARDAQARLMQLQGMLEGVEAQLRECQGESRALRLKAQEASEGRENRLRGVQEKLTEAEKQAREQGSIAEHEAEMLLEADAATGRLSGRLAELEASLKQAVAKAKDAEARMKVHAEEEEQWDLTLTLGTTPALNVV